MKDRNQQQSTVIDISTEICETQKASVWSIFRTVVSTNDTSRRSLCMCVFVFFFSFKLYSNSGNSGFANEPNEASANAPLNKVNAQTAFSRTRSSHGHCQACGNNSKDSTVIIQIKQFLYFGIFFLLFSFLFTLFKAVIQ